MSDKEIEELRALIRSDRRARRGPFSSELRERLSVFLRSRWQRGESLQKLAKELGLSDHTVQYWRSRWGERGEPRARLRRIEIVAERPIFEARLTMHGPKGTRIEDLSFDDALELWRRLS
jgi:hypothetical protein